MVPKIQPVYRLVQRRYIRYSAVQPLRYISTPYRGVVIYRGTAVGITPLRGCGKTATPISQTQLVRRTSDGRCPAHKAARGRRVIIRNPTKEPAGRMAAWASLRGRVQRLEQGLGSARAMRRNCAKRVCVWVNSPPRTKPLARP
jgi:hypothetical protein